MLAIICKGMTSPGQENGDALTPAIETLKVGLEELYALRGTIGNTALNEADPLTRFRLAATVSTLVAAGNALQSFAGKAWPERELKLPPEEKLYECLLGTEYFYKGTFTIYDEPPHNIVIWDDTTLIADGSLTPLTREEVYIVNKLMSDYRGAPTRFFVEKFIRDGEFMSSAQHRTLGMLKALVDKLGENIMYQSRLHGRVFRISRNILLTDNRNNIDESDKSTPESSADDKPGAPLGEGGWGNADYIATQACVPLSMAKTFIALHRLKFGQEYLKPKLLRLPAETPSAFIETEHYPPQFVAWAIANLRNIVIRHDPQEEQ